MQKTRVPAALMFAIRRRHRRRPPAPQPAAFDARKMMTRRDAARDERADARGAQKCVF